MKKYRIYIDEVGNNDLKSSDNPNHRYLSLTGLIFELNYVKDMVTPTLEKLKQKYFSKISLGQQMVLGPGGAAQHGRPHLRGAPSTGGGSA